MAYIKLMYNESCNTHTLFLDSSQEIDPILESLKKDLTICKLWVKKFGRIELCVWIRD